MSDVRIIDKPILAPGTQVMLTEDAPSGLCLQWGSEAVLSVVTTGFTDLESLGDGFRITRHYWLEHCHRGRLAQISERYLVPITKEAASGQKLLYGEQVREGAELLKEFAAMLEGGVEDYRPNP